MTQTVMTINENNELTYGVEELKHKKQAFEQIEKTIEWNETRDNTPDTLNWKLELAMLQEELDEIKLAVKEDSKVDIFDGLLDLFFVGYGTLGKMGLTAEQIVDGYEAVLYANSKKSAAKNAQGKITKPDNWEKYKPEPKLQKILDES